MTLSALVLRCPKCCECPAAQPISTASRGRMGFPRRSKRLGDSVDLLDFYLRSSLRVVLGWVENVENSKMFFLLIFFWGNDLIYIYIYLYIYILYYICLYIYLYLYLYIVFWFIKTLGCSSTCPIMGQIWLAFRTKKHFSNSMWGIAIQNGGNFTTAETSWQQETNTHTHKYVYIYAVQLNKKNIHTHMYI